MTDHPPEPWDLRGQMHTAVFLVPVAAFPPGELDELPPGWSLTTVRGQAVVGAAWVVYEPGGVLSYRELMATVLVRRGWRLAPHIVRIWVDSEASLAGGRALWAIPKELAEFEIDRAGRSTRFAARTAAEPIAVTGVARGLRLPGRWPLAFTVVQRAVAVGGRATARISPVRARGGVALTRSRWIAEPFGPLGFLAGRRALLTVSLRDFVMQFGSAAASPAAQRHASATVS
ncbi:acetoacetate decarboxylase family protein [Jatrophihabitans endophyticus]|uniref:acetoacetate decarboxylase family protein n=1 Tax=Jatrophihabitans endophyticus TaxID=1206085 RepID=UPI001A0FE5A6|nr:acetoacetate decarboxylase family protein [Jatrophihabitans endophyticus]MBE7187665.1 acetoacetate decarboxylase family protein [Jatrophihabitans endophyticus]